MKKTLLLVFGMLASTNVFANSSSLVCAPIIEQNAKGQVVLTIFGGVAENPGKFIGQKLSVNSSVLYAATNDPSEESPVTVVEIAAIDGSGSLAVRADIDPTSNSTIANKTLWLVCKLQNRTGTL
jgi:hypothetical protein